MILEESRFYDIYHKYMIFEADALTEHCKAMVDVFVEDCFMLTTAIIDNTGNLVFPVLAIGPSETDCSKGLNILEALTVFTSFELENVEFMLVEQPTYLMQVKASMLFEEEECGKELALTRKMKELDSQRDLHYPDVLSVNFLSHGKFYSYLVEMVEYNSKFIEGKLLKEPDRDIGVHVNDKVEVVPVMMNNQVQLIAGNVATVVNQETFKKLRDYVNELLEEYPEIEKGKKS